MAYCKKVPPIRLVLSTTEFNNLVDVLTKNIEYSNNNDVVELSKYAKEKLLKYSIPRLEDNELDVKLYNNEIVDIVSLLLNFTADKVSQNNYIEVLLKVREKKD